MDDVDNILKQITGILKPIGIDKLILFGSYAYGNPNAASDIDLLVVTSEESIPKSFAEKSQINIAVNKLLDDIKANFPIDIIVHTRAMHKKFIEMNSIFCREIISKGRVLYERY